jgi:hypothetical protein
MCRLQILLRDRLITEYRSSDDTKEDHLEVPAYFPAEWIAENWWPLLNEPRKSDEISDDADFLSRHSLVTAQHGFALPALSIITTGVHIQLSVGARRVPYADVQFLNSAGGLFRREDVESELRRFVEGNRPIGVLDSTGHGEVLRDSNNRRLGEYDSRYNTTRDADNRLIGTGNLLSSLL